MFHTLLPVALDTGVGHQQRWTRFGPTDSRSFAPSR
jgi:hypothetical protein